MKWIKAGPTKKLLSFAELKKDMIVRIQHADNKTEWGSFVYSEQEAHVGEIVWIENIVIENSGWVYCWGKARRENGTKTVYTYSKKPKAYELLRKIEAEAWIRELKEFTKENLNNTMDRGRAAGTLTGSDPEMLCVDKDGVVIPAFDFLPSIHNTTTNGSSGLLRNPYWDGFQAEFNINPAMCHAAVVDQIQYGLFLLHDALIKHNPTATLTHLNVVEVPYNMMQKCSEQQAGLGCSPSKNAYCNVKPLKVEDPRSLSLRFAGCHIHFGIGTWAIEEYQRYVKTIDKIAGPMLVCMLQGIEDPRRRQYYGLAGEFRTPPHGFEYRVPSSTVLCHPIITHITFDMCRFAKEFARTKMEDLWEIPGGDQQIQHIINNHDIDEARQVLRHNEKIFDQMIKICYSIAPDSVSLSFTLTREKFHKIKSIILNGAKEHLPYNTVVKNWRLNEQPDSKDKWQRHSDAPNTSVVQMTI